MPYLVWSGGGWGEKNHCFFYLLSRHPHTHTTHATQFFFLTLLALLLRQKLDYCEFSPCEQA